MFANKQYEELQRVTWFASDLNDFVAALELGAMNGAIFELAPRWDALDDFVRDEMSDRSEYRLVHSFAEDLRETCPRLEPETFAMRVKMHSTYFEKEIGLYGRKGVFLFRGADRRYGTLSPKYRLYCEPATPITLSELPDSFRQLVARCTIPADFRQIHLLDLTNWLDRGIA